MSNWRDRSACRGVDIVVFYPTQDKPGRELDSGQAHRICRGCSVIRECLFDEMKSGQAEEQYGYRGDMSARARRRLIIQQRRTGQPLETLIADAVEAMRREEMPTQ